MNTRENDERIVESRKPGDATDVPETMFIVKQSGQGRWVVCEGGFEKPLADFDKRDDAIEYARGVAATKPRATVTADGDSGSVPLRESYVLDPSTHRSL